MATATVQERHGIHPATPFDQKPSTALDGSYALPSEDELSPSSAAFPLQQPSPLANSGPIPNPPFIFPARPATSSAPPSFSRATGRNRPRSAYELQGGAGGFSQAAQRGTGRTLPPPLPNFSFSPTALTHAGSGIASPPRSSQSPPGSAKLIPSRPGGHRRGGSEFIGGDGKTGNGLGLMSTSPTKGDGVLPVPNPQPSLGPPAGRRGHAHRRSAAISCHDISLIVKPVSPRILPLGGSAPTSPAGNEPNTMALPGLDAAIRPNTASAISSTEAGELRSRSDSPPTRASNRARVGFSDTIEFIPRPLSLVSSDASSTTTMRPGHSVSNSLSSLMSIGASSPPSKEQRSLPSPVEREGDRPSTAGAILSSTTNSMHLEDAEVDSQRRNSTQLTPEEAKSVENPPTPSLLPRKYFFFGYDKSAGECSPTRSRPVSSASSDKSRSASNLSAPISPNYNSSDVPIASTEVETVPARKTSITRKPSKKQKKVKSWAGSILSRKPRQRSQKLKSLSRRSPTPPLRNYEPTPEVAPVSDFTEANVPTTIDENPRSPSLSNLQTNFASWKPRQLRPQDDDGMSPIIDLDAALGPFNTPMGYDSEWEASQRGSGPTKRRMHSAAGVGGLVGPYHRRAESAPEMVAFENPDLDFTISEADQPWRMYSRKTRKRTTGKK